MCKFRLPLFVLGLMLALSTVSEARVCFLGGGNCIIGNTNIELTNCPNHEVCDVPKQGVEGCFESGTDLFLPQDCCTNEDYWEYCSAAEGKICKGTVCTGKSKADIEYSTCEKGQCVCHPDYNKDCAAEGKVGYGISCNGLYKECRCDKSKYFKCGANASSQGDVCTDSTGTYYSQCVCPSLSADYWEDSSGDCCYYSGSSCQNKPSNTTYYKCKTWSVPNCTCGYTHMSGKPNCLNGCTDSSYDYKGNSEHVVCDSGSVTNLAQTGICGNDCHCATGYWDYKDTCSSLSNSACADLGYKETSCEGDFLACPFDASAKVCIEATTSCANGQILVDDECVNAYENCAEAGLSNPDRWGYELSDSYLYNDGGSYWYANEQTTFINLNGEEFTCYDDFSIKANIYDSCEDAGYDKYGTPMYDEPIDEYCTICNEEWIGINEDEEVACYSCFTDPDCSDSDYDYDDYNCDYYECEEEVRNDCYDYANEYSYDQREWDDNYSYCMDDVDVVCGDCIK